MRDPREALEAARRAAAQAGDDGVDQAPWSLEHTPITMRQLVEWAIIEPDESLVYSTRRFGRPRPWCRCLPCRSWRASFALLPGWRDPTPNTHE